MTDPHPTPIPAPERVAFPPPKAVRPPVAARTIGAGPWSAPATKATFIDSGVL